MTEAAAAAAATSSSELDASATPMERPGSVVSSTAENTQTQPTHKANGEDTKPEECNNGSITASETVTTDPAKNIVVVVEQPATAVATAPKAAPVVSSSKRSRPVYKYDPNKITLRFLFANKDGLTVTVECKPLDTVSEVKGALLSVWPEDLPNCSGGDRLRLICMGKGMLMPDSRTLEDCQVPVFKTHPTPINVSVRPETAEHASQAKGGGDGKSGRGAGIGGASTAGGSGPAASRNTTGNAGATDQGCACIIL